MLPRYLQITLMILVILKSQSITNVESAVCVSSSMSNSNSTHNCSYTLERLEDLSSLLRQYSIKEMLVILYEEVINLETVIFFQNMTTVVMSSEVSTSIKCNAALPRSGFNFSFVQNIQINSIQLHQCGAQYCVSKCSNQGYLIVKYAAFFLSSCSDISFQNVEIITKGSGVILKNARGKVTFQNCDISRNTSISISGSNDTAGHGIMIISNHSNHNINSLWNAEYYIEHCKFKNNSATTSGNGKRGGGGILVSFEGGSCSNIVVIKNCQFSGNKATHGGGVRIILDGTSTNNSATISASQFSDNVATHAGGALHVSVTSFKKSKRFKINNSVSWKNCTFQSNIGRFGSAITVLGQSSIFSIEFESCKFLQNIVSIVTKKKPSRNYFELGALYIENANLTFSGDLYLEKNNGSAITLVNSILTIQAACTTVFANNIGKEGGALNMHLKSSLYVKLNSTVCFIRNVASLFGGAIYWDPLSIGQSNRGIEVRNKFLFMTDSDTPFEKLVTFKENRAGGEMGHQMYATTFKQCCALVNNSRKLKSCLANPVLAKTNDFNTPGIELLAKKQQLYAIPGKEIEIPVLLIDELNQTVLIETCEVEFLQNTITFRKWLHLKTLLNCSHTTLYGRPGERSELAITSLGTRMLETSVSVVILECPPGYIWKNKSRSCECSIANNDSPYAAIERCIENRTVAVAKVKKWYWIGYDGLDSETEDNLISAHHPHLHIQNNRLLPAKASRKQLDELFCGPDRTGVLCSRCVENYTTLFHNNDFECYPETRFCRYGILFYLLSEWIPVTILFSVVFVFDLSFTSGRVNSFIFFAQFLVSMQLEEWMSTLDSDQKAITGILLVYKMLNLDFFSIQNLSFCLWKSASTLDVLAFKYVTIAYSLILVLGSLVAIQKFRLPYCLQRSRIVRTRKRTIGRSVVNGLSSFFVMCYAQCASVSVSILSASLVRGKGDAASYRRMVVYHSGEMEYFQSGHLLYAIPAVVFLLIFVIIPPTLLVVYPLCYKVFQVVHLKETNIKLCCKILPLERLRPLFDSVQGCFKEGYRFFAGLFFLYRLIPQVVFASYKSVTYFGSLEILLILIIAIHCLCRPYKVDAHNKIDICLLVNLLLINTLSCWKYILSAESSNKHQDNDLYIINVLQPLLMLLPLVGLLIYGLWSLIRKRVCAQKRLNRFNLGKPNSEECVLELLDDRERSLESSENFNTGFHRLTETKST